ncbi:MAG TPA: hypothetical protein VF736_07490 [Pyrinomonadaceae bacterium]|jgi:NADPH-dependent 2,4-dienoyl-CoA reductase/sulfur reductase-like enzyme
MGLEAGDAAATRGMSRAIYEQMDAVLSPAFSGLPPAALDEAREGWRKLSFAIAGGVVGYIVSNMEIYDIQVGSQQVGTLTQTGPTTGHVR